MVVLTFRANGEDKRLVLDWRIINREFGRMSASVLILVTVLQAKMSGDVMMELIFRFKKECLGFRSE